jgi:hypothetical protein
LFDARSETSGKLDYSGALSSRAKKALKAKLGIVHHVIAVDELDAIFGPANERLRAALTSFCRRILKMAVLPRSLVLVGGGMRGWKVRDVVHEVFAGFEKTGLVQPFFQVATGGILLLQRFEYFKVSPNANTINLDDKFTTGSIGFVFQDEDDVERVHEVIRADEVIPIARPANKRMLVHGLEPVAGGKRHRMRVDVVEGFFEDESTVADLRASGRASFYCAHAVSDVPAEGRPFQLNMEIDLSRQLILTMMVGEEDATVDVLQLET